MLPSYIKSTKVIKTSPIIIKGKQNWKKKMSATYMQVHTELNHKNL